MYISYFYFVILFKILRIINVWDATPSLYSLKITTVSAAHIIIQVFGGDVQNEGNIRLHFLRIPIQCTYAMYGLGSKIKQRGFSMQGRFTQAAGLDFVPY